MEINTNSLKGCFVQIDMAGFYISFFSYNLMLSLFSSARTRLLEFSSYSSKEKLLFEICWRWNNNTLFHSFTSSTAALTAFTSPSYFSANNIFDKLLHTGIFLVLWIFQLDAWKRENIYLLFPSSWWKCFHSFLYHGVLCWKFLLDKWHQF